MNVGSHEVVVRSVWTEVLSEPPAEGGFLDSGGTSLFATVLVGRIMDETGIRLPVRLLLVDNAGVAELTDYLSGASS